MPPPQTFRLLAKGGVIPPGDLHKLCQVAQESGCDTLGLGSRQEILLTVPDAGSLVAREGLAGAGLPFQVGAGDGANIVTSYGATGIYPATQWLRADTYLDILEQFDYQPRLKINLTDPLQPLVPRFSGDLNFVASAYPAFWHLHVQLPPTTGNGNNGELWPVLVGSEDVARLCYVIEQVYFADADAGPGGLVAAVDRQLPDLTTRPYQEVFAVPRLPFPEYEGFHAGGAGYWLGIFRRDYAYPLRFVRELCELALRCKIGKVCLTPWKTLLVKDIRAEHRPLWEKLLGLHQISTRHAANELNWQLPDLDDQALHLKKHLVNALEAWECTTAGLSFAIGSRPLPVATSVVIEPEPDDPPAFRIRHTADFTRSNTRWRVFARRVPPDALAQKLREICTHYHAAPEGSHDAFTEASLPAARSAPAARALHQCLHCLTVYDPHTGDEAAGVAAGTPFGRLPEAWTCSVCESPQADFAPVDG